MRTQILLALVLLAILPLAFGTGRQSSRQFSRQFSRQLSRQLSRTYKRQPPGPPGPGGEKPRPRPGDSGLTEAEEIEQIEQIIEELDGQNPPEGEDTFEESPATGGQGDVNGGDAPPAGGEDKNGPPKEDKPQGSPDEAGEMGEAPGEKGSPDEAGTMGEALEKPGSPAEAGDAAQGEEQQGGQAGEDQGGAKNQIAEALVKIQLEIGAVIDKLKGPKKEGSGDMVGNSK